MAHQPGSWLVWSGVVVMGIGLLFVFYLVHRAPMGGTGAVREDRQAFALGRREREPAQAWF